jgi:hypothetical protein
MVELKHKVLGSVGTPKEKIEEQVLSTEIMPEADLKSLIELGCIRDEVQIGQLTFSMRSLNAAEKLELAGSMVTEEDDAKLFAFNARMLAMSIETVNGKPFENLHPEKGSSDEARLRCRVDLINSMQTPIIAKLLEFYQEINDRCEAQFTAEQVKN